MLLGDDGTLIEQVKDMSHAIAEKLKSLLVIASAVQKKEENS